MSETMILRHRLVDRLFHWLFAIAIMALIGTGLLPVFGVDFNWVVIHWISGVILTLLVVVHIVRSLFWKNLKAMVFQARDFSKAKAGKYSLEQKLMHNFLTFVTLAAIVTGGLMMVKIDTPFWERNPYWLQAETWGWVYIIHGLMAMVFVSTIMLHIYFAVRPEKRLYLQAMVKGWVNKDAYLQEHEQE